MHESGRDHEKEDVSMLGQKTRDFFQLSPRVLIATPIFKLQGGNPMFPQKSLSASKNGQFGPLSVNFQVVNAIDSVLEREMIERVELNFNFFDRFSSKTGAIIKAA